MLNDAYTTELNSGLFINSAALFLFRTLKKYFEVTKNVRILTIVCVPMQFLDFSNIFLFPKMQVLSHLATGLATHI